METTRSPPHLQHHLQQQQQQTQKGLQAIANVENGNIAFLHSVQTTKTTSTS